MKQMELHTFPQKLRIVGFGVQKALSVYAQNCLFPERYVLLIASSTIGEVVHS